MIYEVVMIYEMALLVCVGLVAWIALDIAFDPVRRRQLPCVLALSTSALLWAAGELLKRHAHAPPDIVISRRILFAGVCSLPAAWVWCASIARRPDASVAARRIFLASLVPGLVAYSCLYLAPGGAFVDWYAVPVRRGPLFYANAAYSWALIAAGAVLMLGAMRRSPSPAPLPMGLVLAAACMPLLANAAYVLLQVTSWDPTPIAFGFSAVVFRFLVIDLTWGAYHAPAARAEVVQQMRTGVLVANLEGCIVDWNQAAEAILHTPDLEGRMLRRVLAHAGAVRHRELEIYEFPLERRGQCFGTGAVVADRTEMRRAELRLEMTTRVEALGYLTAGVAHEINNPLSYVSVNLTLLDRLIAALRNRELDAVAVGALTAEAEDLIADAREGTERIQRIVERMTHLAPSRESSQTPEVLDVRCAVEKAVALASLGKGSRNIELEVVDEIPRVLVAEMDVIQIVLHLLLNAAQEGCDDVPFSIRLRAERGGVAVRVQDSGPGIAEHDLPHVFDPLFTTHRPGAGLGLGLSLCWELARRSGGTIDVENGPEKGAAFTLWLPAAPDEE
jgi:signal transduction histidine kinase